MRSCVVTRCKPYRIGLVLVLIPLLSAWTCTAIVSLNSCPDALPRPQIGSLSPVTISADSASVLLTVNGNSFVRQSRILWNANPLQTTFVDSHHLQATITQQTFNSFGGSAGNSVLISVMTLGSTSVEGCANDGSSATLVLEIS